MTKWYALDYNGDMVYVGAFETFDEAEESMKYTPVWLVDEDCARAWLRELQEMLT